jgi:hypothetical protein
MINKFDLSKTKITFDKQIKLKIMQVNFVILLVSSLIPLFMGFVWYHPKVFGTVWMKEANISDEQIKSSNMAKILILCYILSFFLAFSIQFMVIHQYSLYSLFAGQDITDTNSELGAFFKTILDRVGNNFRTFKHGAFHGFLGGLFSATTIVGINALFERKSFKYVALHAGYWIITMMLMGGVICQFS